MVTGPIPVGHGASGIAVGDGGVWVANTARQHGDADRPRDGRDQGDHPVGAGPRGVAVGRAPCGSPTAVDGTVSRIDPRTDQRVETIPVGGSPEGVAVAAGRVWVTVQAGSPPPPRSPGAPCASCSRRTSARPIRRSCPATATGRRNSRTRPAPSCSTTPTDPRRRERGSCPRSPRPCRRSRATDGPTRSRSGRASVSRRPPTSRSPRARSSARSSASSARDAGPAARVRHGRHRRLRRLPGGQDGAHRRRQRHRQHADHPPRPRRAQPAGADGHAVLLRGSARHARSAPSGVEHIPSAGPYYIASHTPGAELVLRRNPNYHGSRPRRFDEIDYRFGVTPQHEPPRSSRPGVPTTPNAAFGDAAVGEAPCPPTSTRASNARYGPHSPAARSGRQRYFINRRIACEYLLLNPRRPLFASARMRRAVNFAVDRRALARNGRPGLLRPAHRPIPADQHARLPRRRHLPARRPERRTRSQPGRPRRVTRSCTRATAPLACAGRDRQSQPARDRHHGRRSRRFRPARCSSVSTPGASRSTSAGSAGSPTTPTRRTSSIPFTGSRVDFPGAAPSATDRASPPPPSSAERSGCAPTDSSTSTSPPTPRPSSPSPPHRRDFFSARIGCQATSRLRHGPRRALPTRSTQEQLRAVEKHPASATEHMATTPRAWRPSGPARRLGSPHPRWAAVQLPGMNRAGGTSCLDPITSDGPSPAERVP